MKGAGPCLFGKKSRMIQEVLDSYEEKNGFHEYMKSDHVTLLFVRGKELYAQDIFGTIEIAYSMNKFKNKSKCLYFL